MLISGEFYKKCVPKFDQLDEKTRELLIEGIAVNSGYNSQIIEAEQAGQQRKQVCFQNF